MDFQSKGRGWGRPVVEAVEKFENLWKPLDWNRSDGEVSVESGGG
jgi:hypothetical protein